MELNRSLLQSREQLLDCLPLPLPRQASVLGHLPESQQLRLATAILMAP